VFVVGDIDPVDSGLVASLNRPGGNITGMMPISTMLAAKRLQLLHELVPTVATMGVLVNPANPSTEAELKSLLDGAGKLRLHLLIAKASSESDFNEALATLVQQGAGALLLSADNFFTSQRDRLLALAARNALPAIYYYREFADRGGLISYGPSLADSYRQSGVYSGRILRGEKPADLPVQQPTRFEFVINLKTAKALGIDVPPNVLALADEVIE
jgi:putative tryptophan/tyrosine transport system substrate-binding protein